MVTWSWPGSPHDTAFKRTGSALVTAAGAADAPLIVPRSRAQTTAHVPNRRWRFTPTPSSPLTRSMMRLRAGQGHRAVRRLYLSTLQNATALPRTAYADITAQLWSTIAKCDWPLVPTEVTRGHDC